MSRWIVLAALLVGCASTDPAAVTAENLIENERFWPYRVQLTEPLARGEGERPVSARRVGVLIRVEPSGRARIDFGHLGKFEVPIGMTDGVARANRIRRGELEKERPNFTHAIRTRMLSSAGDLPMPLPVEETDGRSKFLCVFADPDEHGFEELARSLAPLVGHPGMQTIFFPQGRYGDRDVHAQLGELGWRVPFLPGFLSGGYTRSLLREGTSVPFLLLQTDEGRLLFEGVASPRTIERLKDALSGESPARPARGTARPAARS